MGDPNDTIHRADARAVLKGWALAIKADATGDACQCPEPDLTGRRSHLCFGCGLYNAKRKAEIGRAMGAPHDFEREADRGILSLFCGFCTYPKDDARHGGTRGRPQPRT
jgi:hypothetical protein